jgi:hypothetical protein
MTCAEFEEVLPEMLEGEVNREQQEHLRFCPVCSDLVSDLDLIAREARTMQADVDPSPRVWNSIEIALRQEGLVHPQVETAAAPRLWRPAWAFSFGAVFLIAIAGLLYERGTGSPEMASVGTLQPRVINAVAAEDYSPEDMRVLASVQSRTPAMLSAYKANLSKVNAYVRDAEQWVRSSPDDDAAQQSLIEAYEQRAVVYQMALDRAQQ